MGLPETTRQLLAPLATVLEDFFGKSLISVVIHGSAATGDTIPMLSDVDVVVILTQPWRSDEAARLHQLVSEIDITPFSRIQPKFLELSDVAPVFVDGTYAVLLGLEPPAHMVQSSEQLTEAGEEWLHELPFLLHSDSEEWSMATGATTERIARLLMTRLKPAVRAHLVREGNDPQLVWAMRWDEMAESVMASNNALGQKIELLLNIARTRDASLDELGSLALDALMNLVTFDP